ncbi:MAG: threonine synthase [Sphingomonadales bacterium]
MADFGTFVTHLECGLTGKVYPKGQLHNLSEAGRPLLVRYDLSGVKKAFQKSDLEGRSPDMWRCRELLPVTDAKNIVSLGEMITPLLGCPALEKKIGAGSETIFIKDEGRLPTGSFKARGLAMAVSMAKELGVKVIAMPTAGNAGAALSAYATRAGIKSYIFSPDDSQEITIQETILQGGDIYLVNGLINDCGKIVGDGKGPVGWFDFSTLKEPYRIEGKKTMGLELAEQMDWQLPDAIFYPTGGGTGLIGMWKAFAELEEIGFITGKMPKMIAVQAEGCAPIVKAFIEGTEHAELWETAQTIAQGMRVPIAVGDFLILRAVRESGGFAATVTDTEIETARLETGLAEGLHIGPEGAATLAAYKNALKSGQLNKKDRVVLFNCGSGLKYLTDLPKKRLDRTKPIDYSQFKE